MNTISPARGPITALPEAYRQRLRTTHSPERLNEEFCRHACVIRVFANCDPAVRLAGAVLVERYEQWATSRRSFDTTTNW